MGIDEGQQPPLATEKLEIDSDMKSTTTLTPSHTNDHTTAPSSSRPTSEIINDNETPNEDENTVTGIKLHIVTLALFLCVFLISLDRTIIATAIPKITNEFHSLSDFSWYQSAFQLTTAAFQLSYGNLYQLFSVKWTFFGAILIFEIGSVICGVANNSIALIIGRAITGVGCSGIFAGSLLIISLCVPLKKRPLYTGILGAMSGVATISGPVLGGVFASKLSWRWCFYINYPFGVFTLIIICLLLETPSTPRSKLPFREKMNQFDFPGTAIFIPMVLCLLLALEWGGSTYAWSSWRIIFLLVLFGVLLLVFLLIEWKKGDLAMLNFRVLKHPALAWSAYLSFMIGAVTVIISYYFPIYFQAIKNVDATQSGVNYIPSALSSSVFAILGGVLTTKFGYVNPSLYLSVIFLSVGVGLMYNLQIGSSSSYWIGVQVPFGAGSGIGLQQPIIALQNIIPTNDLSIAFSTVIFSQTLGGAIFITVAQSIFNNKLSTSLQTEVPSLDPQIVLDAGASDITATIGVINPDFLHGVLVSYMNALRLVFMLATILACLIVIGTVMMPWIKVKGKEKKKKGSEEEAKGADTKEVSV